MTGDRALCLVLFFLVRTNQPVPHPDCSWGEWSTEHVCKWIQKECKRVLTRDCNCAKSADNSVGMCGQLSDSMKLDEGAWCSVSSCPHARMYETWTKWTKWNSTGCSSERKRWRECRKNPLYTANTTNPTSCKGKVFEYEKRTNQCGGDKQFAVHNNDINYDYNGPLSEYNIFIAVLMGLAVVGMFIVCYFCNKTSPNNNADVYTTHTRNSSLHRTSGSSIPLFESGIPMTDSVNCFSRDNQRQLDTSATVSNENALSIEDNNEKIHKSLA